MVQSQELVMIQDIVIVKKEMALEGSSVTNVCLGITASTKEGMLGRIETCSWLREQCLSVVLITGLTKEDRLCKIETCL